MRGDPRFVSWWRDQGSRVSDPGSPLERAVCGKSVVYIADARREEAYSTSPVYRTVSRSAASVRGSSLPCERRIPPLVQYMFFAARCDHSLAAPNPQATKPAAMLGLIQRLNHVGAIGIDAAAGGIASIRRAWRSSP